jgi:hypothetical protein
MAFAFNPFTGNFDLKGSGGGGGSAFFAGEVATYADLPLDGTAALDSRWLVRSNSGTWPFSTYKQAGVYVRTATGGTDRDADYTLTDTSFHDVMSDDAFVLFDDGDATKNLKFQLSGITTGQTRTLTVPDKNITIADDADIPSTLDDLSNVSAAAPSDNDVLVFDTATGTWVAEAPAGGGGIAGSTGSTDNAILRADGTGGSTAQDSALVISDYTASTQGNVAIQAEVAGFSVTGVAATNVFTAVGHNFIADQMVSFTSLTGGGGLATNRAYFVRDISGDTFKLANESGGGARTISTDLTAGTIVPSAAIALIPQGFGGLMTAIPDGTSTNGNFRGYGSVDLCFSRNNAARVASGRFAAIVSGINNTASADESAVVGGENNTASGAESFVGGGNSAVASATQSACLGGNQASASGIGAVALGGFQNQATAVNALAHGRQGRADRYAILAHGNKSFATAGDSQRFRAVLSQKTTTDAAVEMALDSDTTYLTIPSGKVIFCNIKVVGVKSDGSAVATYERQYAVKNVAGTSTEIYAPVTIGSDNAASTSLAVSCDDTGDFISIKPTGIAAETWRWVASVDAVEVAYGS